MNKKRTRTLKLLLPILVCCLGLPSSAQSTANDPWDVIGAYNCTTPLTDSPPHSLFLLPDMRWDSASPFTPKSVRAEWIEVQTRGWRGRLPYALQPPGIFSFESGIVRLYNVEMIEDSGVGSLRSSGLLRGLVKGFPRPSALASPAQSSWQAQMLIQTFRFEARYQQLVEVLPADSVRLPVRCDRLSLFTLDSL